MEQIKEYTDLKAFMSFVNNCNSELTLIQNRAYKGTNLIAYCNVVNKKKVESKDKAIIKPILSVKPINL